MGKPDKPKMSVTQYFASIHYGIAYGPLDYILKIFVQEKEAWSGRYPDEIEFIIDQEELFGGIKKEGGVAGHVTYLPGGPDQVMPNELAERAGKTTATMPAYRGIASAFFHTSLEDDEYAGFYWTANSPYLPGVWIKAARASVDLMEQYARIYLDSNTITKRDIPDVNANVYSKDIADGKIVHLNTAGNKIIVETSREGEVLYEIPITYTLLWVIISEDTGEILALEMGETSMHVYDLESGSEKQVLSGLSGIGYPTLSSRPSNIVEVEDNDVIYHWCFWKVYTSLQAIVRNGETGLWSKAWINSLGLGILWSYGGIVAASPNGYIAHKTGGDSASPYSITWSDTGIGSVTYRTEHYATTGWNMTLEVLNSITWMPETETFFFKGAGQHMSLSEDLTEVVNYSASGESSGAQRYTLSSRRAQYGGPVLVFSSGARASPYWGHVYMINSEDGEVIFSEPLSEFGFTSEVFNNSYLEIGNDDSSSTMLMHNGPEAWALVWPDSPFDSNPSHIIYECLVNNSWGMGAPESAIDIASFQSAALVLYNERLGLSLMWTQQTSIESFISEIIDHINATIFVSPRTGKITLKLIRDDYDIVDLQEFTPDNSLVTKFGSKLWGETINEIVVTWTNPENEEEETVTAQDDANISIQGGIISDGRNYYGVRRADLAMELAQRDLRSASIPLASCDIEVNREAWALLPGDCCILNSPEDGVDSIVMRVGQVDYGKPGDPTVKAALVEDVFSLGIADYTVPPESMHEDTSETPTPADNTLIFTLPYYFTVNKISTSIMADVEYPEVFAGVLASEEGNDTNEFELYGEVTGTLGGVAFANIGTKMIASRSTLPEELPAAVSSTLSTVFSDRTQGNGPRNGGFMLIEGADETEHEICLFTDVDSGSSPPSCTMNRGMLDTVPRTWPAGTPVWFIDSGLIFQDQTIRSGGEEVNYKILPRTSLGLLSFVSAPMVTQTLTERLHLPTRPADVTFAGDDGFSGAIDATLTDPIPITWSRRNRVTEDSVMLDWDDGDVAPEDGQTTRITVFSSGGAVLTVHDDISGISFDLPVASFLGNSIGRIRVESKRDDLISLQGYEFIALVEPDGYGYSYGYNYGGA